MSSPAMRTHWEMRCFGAHWEIIWELIMRSMRPFLYGCGTERPYKQYFQDTFQFPAPSSSSSCASACLCCVCVWVYSIPSSVFLRMSHGHKKEDKPKKKKKKLQEREWDNVKSRSFRIFTSTVFIYKDESLKTKWFPPRCSYLYNVSFRFFESIKILLLLLLLLVATGIPQRHSISN